MRESISDGEALGYILCNPTGNRLFLRSLIYDSVFAKGKNKDLINIVGRSDGDYNYLLII